MKFIQKFAILGIACLFFSCQQPEKVKEEKIVEATAVDTVGKNIGLQLYSLRDTIMNNFDFTIKKVGEMGYKFVEAAGYADGKFYNLTPEEYKAKLEAAGLTMISSHTSKEMDKAKMDSVWIWWDQCIDAHTKAGAKYIVCPWMTTPKKIEDLKAFCDYLNQIGEKCNAKGIRFGYHNHDFEFTKIGETVIYDYMLENTTPSLVFFEMDVYWVVKGGQSPVEYFKKYPGRFELFHVKDLKELGESGMVGFDAIFKYAKEAGLKYPVVEVEQYSLDPLESVKVSLDYLQNAAFVQADYSK